MPYFRKIVSSTARIPYRRPREADTRKTGALVVNIYTPLKLFMKWKANVPTLNGAFLSLLPEMSKKFSGRMVVFAYGKLYF